MQIVIKQNELVARLKCPLCDAENNFAVSEDISRIVYCRACSKNFRRDEQNADTVATYLKEIKDKIDAQIPSDVLRCRYCSGWVWSVNRDGTPSHCVTCSKNFPKWVKPVQFKEEMVKDRITGDEVKTGRLIPVGELPPEMKKPILVDPKVFEQIDKQRYKYPNEIMKEETAGSGNEDEGNVIEPVAKEGDPKPGVNEDGDSKMADGVEAPVEPEEREEKPERARKSDGTFKADDPSTPDINEAYEAPKKKAAPKKKKKAAPKKKVPKDDE